MYLHDYMTLGITLVFLLFSPLYIVLRNRMVSANSKKFSKRYIFRLVIVNVVLLVLAYIYFLISFVSIIYQIPSFSFREVIGILIFFVAIGLTFYGGGIYITSIVLEQYTLPELKRLKAFKTQFIATHLFHGPISHILIYSGYIIAMLILALLSLKGNIIVNSSYSLLIFVSGVLLGIFYASAQIYNGTFPYQFITGLTSLIIFSILTANSFKYVFLYGVATYFLGFIITFLSVTLSAIIWLNANKKEIWDRSGY